MALRFIVFLLISRACAAQEITIYSEFERFNPFGSPVAQDRNLAPREIISPAVPRNGHLSVQLVVTAPRGTNYFLYTASNPPGIVQMKLYREHFVPCGVDYCPDWLTELKTPSFGAMPESVRALPGQTTRCYLLDIYVPPDVPPRRIRVEALLKTGIWNVAPMELRVIEAVIPAAGRTLQRDDVAPVDAQAGDTAQRQLLRYLTGLPIETSPAILRLRDIIQRNAAEDFLLAPNPDRLNLLAWHGYSFFDPDAEWYLHVRDIVYRFSR